MSVAVVEPAGLTINDPRVRLFATVEASVGNLVVRLPILLARGGFQSLYGFRRCRHIAPDHQPIHLLRRA
jgi:hypothetical protein